MWSARTMTAPRRSASVSSRWRSPMARDDVWILGIHMTKFGKHPDRDTVDLAAEAALNALADGGVTMRDMGVLAAGNLMGAAAGLGQQLQKQIGQTGIPVFNVANACATGATAIHVDHSDRSGARRAGVGDVEHRNTGLSDLFLQLLADARAGLHQVAGGQDPHVL